MFPMQFHNICTIEADFSCNKKIILDILTNNKDFLWKKVYIQIENFKHFIQV